VAELLQTYQIVSNRLKVGEKLKELVWPWAVYKAAIAFQKYFQHFWKALAMKVSEE
jgi:hypothetical protein